MKGVEGARVVREGSRHYQEVKQLVRATLKDHVNHRLGAYHDIEEARFEAFGHSHHVEDRPEDVEGAPESPGEAVEIV